MNESDEIVPVVLDLNIAKSGEINESFLTMFGSTIKILLRKMFQGNTGRSGQGAFGHGAVKIRGTQSQIKSFSDALNKEKAYITSYQKYGLDDPKTYKNKARLKSSISKFERDTGLKWPFK